MNFFDLALNNIKKKFVSYMTYFISTVFAVTIFNIFCSIYYNPQFSQYRFGTGKMAVVFKASAVAVILFSSVFVLYANKFFVKTRKKEIAVYSLLGMKKSQIGRMLFCENILMGMLSIACGVFLGIVFSRFLTMILLNLMAVGTKVVFSIQSEAILTTIAAFLVLFVINSLNTYGIIYRYKLIELLTANKEGERIPKYSIISGLLSVLMIITGYIIAVSMDVNKGGFKLLLPSFIVLLLVVTGTILFFKNFIPMAIVKLIKNKNFYYKSDNFISMSQIIYRIKANSNMLSIIAILSAATITMMSSTFSMYKGLENTAPYYSPFSFMSKNVDDEQYNNVINTIDSIKEVNLVSVNRFNVIKVQGRNSLYTLESENDPGKAFNAYIISQSDYKSIIKNTNVKTGSFNNLRTDFHMDLKDDECYFIDSNTDNKYCEKLSGSPMEVQFSDNTHSYKVTGVSLHKYLGIFDRITTIVLNDKTYKEYFGKAGKKDVLSFMGLMFDKPMESEKTVDALNSIVPENKEVMSSIGMHNLSYVGIYKSIFSLFGAYVFIGMFLGILFLLASGSIIYYKQIIEAQDEVTRYDILKKTGMSWIEIKQSISKQLAVIFGMPLLVGLLHSFFALLTYNKTMDLLGKETPTLSNAFLIVVIYVIIYCFYYILSVNSYMRIVWGKKQ